jgi:hypothetical protein
VNGTTDEQLEIQWLRVYGPFPVGSPARDLRDANSRQGLRTCWQCFVGYRRRRVHRPDGRVADIGHGKMFCSMVCYRAFARRHEWMRGWQAERPIPGPSEILAEMRDAYAEFARALS